MVVGLNDTMENLMKSLDKNEAEISPSTLYAIACVLENVPFINGSPQNTFVPGIFLTALSGFILLILKLEIEVINLCFIDSDRAN